MDPLSQLRLQRSEHEQQLGDQLSAKLGLPVIINRHVPYGTVYMLNGNMMVVGAWRDPNRFGPVGAIIASQRRRRHR